MLSPQTEPGEDAPPAEAVPTRPGGITGRAVVIGLLLIPVLCAWNVYCDIVAQATEMAVMSLSIGVVFALLVLLLINAGLKAVAPRLAFTRAELLTIYVMQAASIGISGVGMTQFLCMGLANVFHYATPGNRWAQDYFPYLARWAFPDPAALPAFYDGHSTLLTAAHLRGWLSPVLAWTGFLFVLLTVTLCLSTLLRRRWVDQEKLTFPLVVLPLELARQDGGLWRSKALWLGFGVAFLLENLAAFANLYPTLPFLPLKASDSRLALGQYIGQLPTPWNAVGDLNLSFYPMVVGLTYLLPQDVSFSCWFFFLLRKLEDVTATGLGFRDAGVGLALARVPYVGEQGLGGFLGLALFSLWNARRYFGDVFRTALGRQGALADDRNEPMPYRWACVGLVAGLLALVAFAVALGTPLHWALALMVLWLLVVVAYTRIRAEAGLAWAFGPDMTPHAAIIAATGTGPTGVSSMVGLTQFQWMDLDYRCTVMPNQLEAFKIAGEARINQRRLCLALLAATLVGILASWTSILSCYYHYGAATAQVNDYRTSMGTTPWTLLDGWVGNFAPPDTTRLLAVALGVVVTGVLMALRARFLWWPLHPIGYVLSGTFTMVWIWCAVFVGWLCKWLILRYGGLQIYRLALPFFVGLILGDYVVGSLWAVYGCVTDTQPYRVAPI